MPLVEGPLILHPACCAYSMNRRLARLRPLQDTVPEIRAGMIVVASRKGCQRYGALVGLHPQLKVDQTWSIPQHDRVMRNTRIDGRCPGRLQRFSTTPGATKRIQMRNQNRHVDSPARVARTTRVTLRVGMSLKRFNKATEADTCTLLS